jgi:hypothetical protein
MVCQLPIFVDEVPEYEARDGFMHVRWRGLEICLPIVTCEKSVASCNRALDLWHERAKGKVVRFPAH